MIESLSFQLYFSDIDIFWSSWTCEDILRNIVIPISWSFLITDCKKKIRDVNSISPVKSSNFCWSLTQMLWDSEISVKHQTKVYILTWYTTAVRKFKTEVLEGDWRRLWVSKIRVREVKQVKGLGTGSLLRSDDSEVKSTLSKPGLW